jgi:hypothetical protein
MIENVKELFEQYTKMNIPCIISAFVSDGRRIMFVVVGFKGNEILGVTRDTTVVGHFNPATIIEWRDYSGNKTNIISKQEAKVIYEKHVSLKVNPETSDGSQRSEAGETNGETENHGTAVTAV